MRSLLVLLTALALAVPANASQGGRVLKISQIKRRPAAKQCRLPAKKLVWAPSLTNTLSVSEVTLQDFQVKSQILHEPLENVENRLESLSQREDDDRQKTRAVVKAAQEFEILFGSLLGANPAQLTDQFVAKELKRAHYWVEANLSPFSGAQKDALQRVLSKWVRHFFKKKVPRADAPLKRIIVRRIEALDIVFQETTPQLSQIFCFDR